MAHKKKQCEAMHPLHNKQCWLREHDTDERHMTVLTTKNKAAVTAYWSAS